MFFCMFASYALAFWYGASRVNAGDMNAGQVLKKPFLCLFTY